MLATRDYYTEPQDDGTLVKTFVERHELGVYKIITHEKKDGFVLESSSRGRYPLPDASQTPKAFTQIFKHSRYYINLHEDTIHLCRTYVSRLKNGTYHFNHIFYDKTPTIDEPEIKYRLRRPNKKCSSLFTLHELRSAAEGCQIVQPKDKGRKSSLSEDRRIELVRLHDEEHMSFCRISKLDGFEYSSAYLGRIYRNTIRKVYE